MADALITCVSLAASVSWLVVLACQVRTYGYRTWMRLGVGMGADREHLDELLALEEEEIAS